jgi:CBS domain-containing protein
MEVGSAMSGEVKVASPNQSIRDAARIMAKIDAGALPVSENGRLEGMITDRDIAVRAVALGMGPDTPIREIMSEEVRCCFEDDGLDEVAREMAALKIRRMPVLNRLDRLVGILSLGDIARAKTASTAGSALSGISKPGGDHCQSADLRGNG